MKSQSQPSQSFIEAENTRKLKRFINKWFVKRILNESFRALNSSFHKWKSEYLYTKKVESEALVLEKVVNARQILSTRSVDERYVIKNAMKKRTEVERNCIRDILFSIHPTSSIFLHMNNSQIEKLCNEIEFEYIEKKKILFVQQSYSYCAYILAMGNCDLYYHDDQQSEIDLLNIDDFERDKLFDENKLNIGKFTKTLTAPTIFGDLALVSEKYANRSATAVTQPGSCLLTIPKETYLLTLAEFRMNEEHVRMASEILRESHLFSRCSDAKIKSISIGLKYREINTRGTIIVSRQEKINSLFLVVSGEVRAYADDTSPPPNKSSSLASSSSSAKETKPYHAHKTHLTNTSHSNVASFLSSGAIALAQIGRGVFIGEREVLKKQYNFDLFYITQSATVLLGEMDVSTYEENTTVDRFKYEEAFRNIERLHQISDEARNEIISRSNNRKSLLSGGSTGSLSHNNDHHSSGKHGQQQQHHNHNHHHHSPHKHRLDNLSSKSLSGGIDYHGSQNTLLVKLNKDLDSKEIHELKSHRFHYFDGGSLSDEDFNDDDNYQSNPLSPIHPNIQELGHIDNPYDIHSHRHYPHELQPRNPNDNTSQHTVPIPTALPSYSLHILPSPNNAPPNHHHQKGHQHLSTVRDHRPLSTIEGAFMEMEHDNSPDNYLSRTVAESDSEVGVRDPFGSSQFPFSPIAHPKYLPPIENMYSLPQESKLSETAQASDNIRDITWFKDGSVDRLDHSASSSYSTGSGTTSTTSKEGGVPPSISSSPINSDFKFYTASRKLSGSSSGDPFSPGSKISLKSKFPFQASNELIKADSRMASSRGHLSPSQPLHFLNEIEASKSRGTTAYLPNTVFLDGVLSKVQQPHSSNSSISQLSAFNHHGHHSLDSTNHLNSEPSTLSSQINSIGLSDNRKIKPIINKKKNISSRKQSQKEDVNMFWFF